MTDPLSPASPALPLGGPSAEPEISHQRLEVLDGLRGIASMVVVVFHSLAFFAPLAVVAGFFRNGEFAVEIFFALSGYVLTVAYGERIVGRGFGTYAGRRVARLVPLHIFCFGLALLVCLWWKVGGHVPGLHQIPRPIYFDNHEILPQLTLTQSLGTNRLAWNFPSWSLSGELWASLLLGLIFLTTGRVRRLLLIVGAALSLVLLYRASHTLVYTYTVWRALVTICIGALVASLPKSLRSPAWLSALVLVATPFAMILLHGGHKMTATGHKELFFPFFAGLLVFAIARGSGPAIAVLSIAPVRELGRRSYSIYLLHGSLLLLVVETGYMLPARWAHRYFTGSTGLLVWVVFVAFVVFISNYTVDLIEKAWQTRLRRVFRVS